MSAERDCTYCLMGDHAKHDPNHWAAVKGLIGGWICRCKGDCKERNEARFNEWAVNFVTEYVGKHRNG